VIFGTAFLRHFLSVALLLGSMIIVSDGHAQTGALNKDPSILLKKYLDLDLKGARLNPLTWEAQKPYIAWKEETIWGHVVVITGYQVIEDIDQWDVKNNLDVVIPVEFKVVGSIYLEKAVFFPEPHVERIGFRLKAMNGIWRVIDPIVPPHVGQKRVINFVRQAMVEEKDPAHLSALTALRDDVRRQQ
jgi:hypothetical protein